METYTFLRQLADSWMLLALFVFFLGVIVWVFLPRNRAIHEDAASIPLRNDDRPLADMQTPEEEARDR